MQELIIRHKKEGKESKPPGRFKNLTLTKKIIYSFIVFVASVMGIVTLISLIPFKGNIKLLTIRSGSMEPTIPVGSVAIIKPTYKYNVGDIIAFDAKGKGTVTHRIAGINYEKAEVITKGDANKSVDNKTINHSNINGRVMLWVPYIGYVISYARTLPGLILLVLIPAISIVADELLEVRENLNLITIKK